MKTTLKLKKQMRITVNSNIIWLKKNQLVEVIEVRDCEKREVRYATNPMTKVFHVCCNDVEYKFLMNINYFYSHFISPLPEQPTHAHC